MNLPRVVKHLTTTNLAVRRCFPLLSRQALEQAIQDSEARHSGEIRFAVEAALDLRDVLRGKTPRQRALEAFAELGVWDTEDNSGVLIYLLLADHAVEIVADRGIHRRIEQTEWDAICHDMAEAFRQRRFEEGALTGVRAIGALLEQFFPPAAVNPDELPNKVEFL